MIHDALIHWTPETVRGKRELPPTLRYVGLSRFPEDVPGQDEAWSVVIRFDQPPPEQASRTTSRGRIQFLVDEAPHERLRPGAKFELYEGPFHVANVEVLD